VGFALHDLPHTLHAPGRAWATGSAAHNLVGLDRKEDQAADHLLCMPDLSSLADELMAQPVRKVARRRGEDPRRIVLLPPGLVVVAAILDNYQLSEATVVPEGLREGVIRAGVRNPASWWQG
jgi:exopolyphosphatase/pppGpp-phosphohydrolase